MDLMLAVTGFHIESRKIASSDHFHSMIYNGEDIPAEDRGGEIPPVSEMVDKIVINPSDRKDLSVFLSGSFDKEEACTRKEFSVIIDEFRDTGNFPFDNETVFIYRDRSVSCGISIKKSENLRGDENVYALINPSDDFKGFLPELYIGNDNNLNKRIKENLKGQDKYCALYRSDYSISIIPLIITGALSIYNRFLPSSIKGFGENRDESFYKLVKSMTWFGDKRKLFVSYKGFSFSMEEYGKNTDYRPNRYLAFSTPFIFPITGCSKEEIKNEASILKKEIENNSALPETAKKQYLKFKTQSGKFTGVLTSADRKGILNELDFFIKGIDASFEKAQDFQTPSGSFFTPDPLGIHEVAFVYPGVGSLYTDLSRDLFQIFPEIFSFLAEVVDPSEVVRADEIYTKEIDGDEDIFRKKRDRYLRKNLKSLSKSGIAFSYLYTMATGSMGIKPSMGLGYSMGEVAMFTSLGVWKDPGILPERLQESDIFENRLSGKMNAVRQYWKDDVCSDKIWEQYTVFASASEVEDLLKYEKRVFLILINTDSEVVIAGDPDHCLNFIEKHSFSFYPLNIPLCIHCPPTYLEYDNIADLFTLETSYDFQNIKIFSSSCYLEVPKRDKAVANSIAKTFCEKVDFPKLVRKTFDAGARIFVEAGPRKICSQWIDEILKGERFVTVPMNVKGTDDTKTIVKAVAKLVSHGVDVDLKKFYREL